MGFDWTRFSVWQTDSAASSPRLLWTLGSDGKGKPDVSPDGARAVVARFGFGGALDLLDLATGGTRSLGVFGTAPRWSPDGAWIAYLSTSDARVTIVRPDGTGVRGIAACASAGNASLAWSPDGTWLVCDGATGPQLVRVADGLVLPLPRLRLTQPDWR